jgi:hypothetical protein
MKPFTKLASVIFGFLCLAHIIRLITQFQIVIGSHTLPFWISFFAVAFTAIMCMALWRESEKVSY